MSTDTPRREPLLTRENAIKAARNPGEALRHLHERAGVRLRKLLSRDYREFYLDETKADIEDDPAGAVGPADLWDEMRAWQFEFLVDEAGLGRDDTLLDLGCGVLRGGIPLIDYLDAGHYVGMDISADALAKGREFVREHGLEHKNPRLVNNDDLRFQHIALSRFQADIVWAQSVLTHLPPEEIQELLAHVDQVLDEGGMFYATWYEADEIVERRNGIGFEYPLSALQRWAESNGLIVAKVPCDHPNDLQMVVFHQAGGGQ